MLTVNGRVTVDHGGIMAVNGQPSGVFRSLGNLDHTYGLRVGNEGVGRFEQDSIRVDITNNLYVGRLTSSNGTYVLNSGDVRVRDGFMSVGSAGRGEFIQNSNSSVVDVPTLSIGRDDGGKGTYRLNEGLVRANIVYVGEFSGAHGRLLMNNGGRLDLSGSLRIGNGGTGTFEQSGGRVDAVGTLRLGVDAPGDGTYTMTGGVAEIKDVILVGQAGRGHLVIDNDSSLSGLHLTVGSQSQSTGTVIQRGVNSLVHIDGNLRIAVASTSTGSYE
jgi:hypothetical protein